MTRNVWVIVHRYAGLYMAGFLIVVGVTGSLIAFYDELDRAINPRLFRVTPRGTVLGAPALIERAEARVPEGRVTDIILPRAHDQSVMVRMEPRTDPATNTPYVLDFTELYIDPYTGEELGRRRFGDISQGLVNLVPFIYRFHYSLALGQIGTWLLGIAALIWTLDCFVGFYLTLPVRRRSQENSLSPQGEGTKRFWQRWKPAWLIKRSRLNFDLHRAGGLWVWPMLLVFAWSAVAFNLKDQVYMPVMRTFFKFDNLSSDVPALDRPLEQPALGWREALQVGRKKMVEQAALHGFVVEHEGSLWLDREHGAYHYGVHSDRDVGAGSGMTSVSFDANNGALKALSLPSGQHAGNTVTNWLYALHQGEVFGLPYRIFVCMMGLVITMLSVTGIIIWLKKRRSRRIARLRGAMCKRESVSEYAVFGKRLEVAEETQQRMALGRGSKYKGGTRDACA